MVDATAAVRSGATSLGFVFASGNRTASRVFAAEVAQAHPSLDRVGVVQNLNSDQIFELIAETSITSLQFHGSETLEFVEKLRAELNSHRFAQLFKASALNLDDRLSVLGSIRFIRALDVDEKLTREMIESWSAVVDVILFDSPRSTGPRQASPLSDVSRARSRINLSKLVNLLDSKSRQSKFWIAGRLNAQNVASAMRYLQDHQLNPDGVDVSSGVEVSAGIKDQKMLNNFIENVKSARGERRAT